MPNLDCTATKCTYNVDEFCAKGSILVAGRDAKQPEETCCSSFQECSSCGCKNADRCVSRQVDVECEAKECVYNESGACNAGHIGITGNSACECRETECSSFRQRK